MNSLLRLVHVVDLKLRLVMLKKLLSIRSYRTT